YILYGGPGADGMPEVRLDGEDAGDDFGVSVAGLGDINGDGFDDVIVGAPLHGAGGSKPGRAYVYFGGVEMDAVPDLVLDGERDGDQFGNSVASAGDFNGDGRPDIVVGGYNHGYSNTRGGRAYVYFGGPGLDATPDRVIESPEGAYFFGY